MTIYPIHCDDCGNVIAYTPDQLPIPVLYCFECAKEHRDG